MTLQEILAENSIEFVEESGHHHARPGYLQLQHCPWCGSNNYHLGFNLAGQFFTCWKCRGHPIVATLLKLGVTKQQAWDFFKGRRVDVSEFVEPVRAGKLVEPKYRGPLQPAHRRYLLGRGFDPDRIARIWGVEGIGLAAHLSWRLYIPITHAGKRVSWTTRAIGENVEQRYISASAQEETMNHKDTVYGLDLCQSSVVIVEGPIDAWAVGPGAGALFGIAFTTAQVLLLSRIPYRFVCFDSAPDAQAQARSLSRQLSAFPGVTSNVILDAKDPGGAAEVELESLRKFARLS